MSANRTPSLSATTHRPTGILQPEDDAARRAERALSERRYDDAAQHIRTIPDRPLTQRFWKTCFHAMDRAARNRLAEAEALAWQSLGIATALGCAGSDTEQLQSDRLGAHAMNLLGTLLRRQERSEDALRLHQAALQRFNTSGSVEEDWSAMIECALDADVAGASDQALSWLDRAEATAAAAQEEPLAKQAQTLGHKSRVLAAAERFEQAVECARRARSLWHQHDQGAASAVLSDVRLGSTLVTAAAEQCENGGSGCHRAALGEAIALLAEAEDSLAAFGAEFDPDRRWAREQLDFARRMKEFMDDEPHLQPESALGSEAPG